MSDEPEVAYILPAEHFGEAKTEDGILDIGGVKIPYRESLDDTVQVYVRRLSTDLSISEIHITRHDGLLTEQLEHQDTEAEAHPLGPKEYWRSIMVGKYRYGKDQHLMTDEEFEADWPDDDIDEDTRRRALDENLWC